MWTMSHVWVPFWILTLEKLADASPIFSTLVDIQLGLQIKCGLHGMSHVSVGDVFFRNPRCIGLSLKCRLDPLVSQP